MIFFACDLYYVERKSEQKTMQELFMDNNKVVKIGIIGLGPRAETLLASIFAMPGEVEVTAL